MQAPPKNGTANDADAEGNSWWAPQEAIPLGPCSMIQTGEDLAREPDRKESATDVEQATVKATLR